MIIQLINTIYQFLWGDFIRIPLPGGSSLGISLLILLLIPTGIFFTIRTHFLPIRLFPDMLKALTEKKNSKNSLSSFQALIVSTATRVGMGNLWVSWLSFRRRQRDLYSGCGITGHHRFLHRPSLKPPWLSSIRKRILSTAATAAGPPTISIIWSKNDLDGKSVMY